MLLRLSSELYDPSDHAAIDATFLDRETASKHYCRWTNYCVQTLNTTALVDTETQAILDDYCATGKPHDTQHSIQSASSRTILDKPLSPWSPTANSVPLEFACSVSSIVPTVPTAAFPLVLEVALDQASTGPPPSCEPGLGASTLGKRRREVVPAFVLTRQRRGT